MHLAIYLTLVATGLFGVLAPRVSRHLPPGTATWLLSVGSVLVAAVSSGVLALLTFMLAARLPAVDARTHWSSALLAQRDPVPAAIGASAAVVLCVAVARTLASAVRRAMALREAYGLSRLLPAHGGELAVIDEPDLYAYAVPGRPGRIVVSSGLLRALDPAQRRAVLAHERAHLTDRHHLHLAATALASAANPLLVRLNAAVALSTERWADERAAGAHARATVASAIVRVATPPGARPTPVAVMAATGSDIALRLAALSAPPTRFSWWRMALLTGMVVVVAAAGLEAAHDTEHLFEMAQRAYQAGLH